MQISIHLLQIIHTAMIKSIKTTCKNYWY